MSNSDLPASPNGLVQKRRINPNDPGSDFAIMSYSEAKYKGLTKLERFTMAAMQSVVAGDIHNDLTVEMIAEQAIEIAMATLERLGRVDE